MRRLLILMLFAGACLPAQNATYVDLSGDWRKSGDDNPRYADPAFDDSGWGTVRLPWMNLNLANRQPTGVYWLRRKASLPAGAESPDLALTLGTVNEIYEVFVNGSKIGSTGQLNTRDLQIARPRTFNIPRELLNASPFVVVAIRVWRPYQRLFAGQLQINNRGPYCITDLATVPKDAARLVVSERWTSRSTDYIIGTTEVTLGALILLTWLSYRPRRELLWLGLFLLFDAVQRIALVHELSLASYPNRVTPVLQLISAANFGFQFELCAAVAGFRSLWLRAAGWLMVMIGLIVQPLGQQFNVTTRGLVMFLAAGLLLVAIAQAGRSQRNWSRLGLLALLLAEVLARMSRVGYLGRDQTSFIPMRVDGMGDFGWELQGLILLLTGFGAAILLILQLLSDRREKERLATELEAGRAVQSLLLGQPQIRGAAVEAVYISAHEVGGDFYAVLDNQLLVAGDVSGKGLRAAMMVSLVLGVLRAVPQRNPGEVLAALNRAIADRVEGGFVTCLCARFDSDGQVTIANAGHVAPYRDGVELAFESGLPLGIDPDAAFAESSFDRGTQLTFVSDGIVEAANAKGELFGFERTAAISTQSAQEIAEAAKAWGQNDDITVVTVRRTT